jgi:hypothetical protein
MTCATAKTAVLPQPDNRRLEARSIRRTRSHHVPPERRSPVGERGSSRVTIERPVGIFESSLAMIDVPRLASDGL